MPRLLVGTSGWVYAHWKGVFYPEDLRQEKWLSFYSERFNTVEVNNTFYMLPEREVFEKWAKTVPQEFLFTIKGNRFITHVKKLRDTEDAVARFFDNLEGLGGKCAAVLFQFPPRWKADPVRLERFLDSVPARARIVLEFRDGSWLREEVYEIMRVHGAALCAADSPFYPGPRDVTAKDFVFYRMHGGHGRNAPDYSEDELVRIAEEIAEHLEEGRDVLAYFNNDYAGFAVKNAVRLKEILSEKGW